MAARLTAIDVAINHKVWHRDAFCCGCRRPPTRDGLAHDEMHGGAHDEHTRLDGDNSPKRHLPRQRVLEPEKQQSGRDTDDVEPPYPKHSVCHDQWTHEPRVWDKTRDAPAVVVHCHVNPIPNDSQDLPRRVSRIYRFHNGTSLIKLLLEPKTEPANATRLSSGRGGSYQGEDERVVIGANTPSWPNPPVDAEPRRDASDAQKGAHGGQRVRFEYSAGGVALVWWRPLRAHDHPVASATSLLNANRVVFNKTPNRSVGSTQVDRRENLIIRRSLIWVEMHMAGRVFIDKNSDSTNMHRRRPVKNVSPVRALKRVCNLAHAADVASRRAEQPSLHTRCLPGNEAVSDRAVVAYIIPQLPHTTTLPPCLLSCMSTLQVKPSPDPRRQQCHFHLPSCSSESSLACRGRTFRV
jgi:hypothetical protein